jgi:hypothetical protein
MVWRCKNSPPPPYRPSPTPSRRAVVEELGNGDRRSPNSPPSCASASRRSRATCGCSGKPGWPAANQREPAICTGFAATAPRPSAATCSGCGRTPPPGTGWPPLTQGGHGAGRDRAAAARVRRAVLPGPGIGPAGPTCGGRRPIARPRPGSSTGGTCAPIPPTPSRSRSSSSPAPGSTRVWLEHRAWNALDDGAVCRDRNQADW